MYQRRTQLQLQVGDKVAIAGPGYTHVGIVVETPFVGSALIAHNAKGKVVEVVTLETFAAGRSVEIVQRVMGGRSTQEEVVARALSLLGQPYDLFLFNCEHYANYSQTGTPSSPQLLLLAAAAVMLGLLLLSEA